MDGIQYKMVDGKVEGVEMMYSTMTKWMRICIDGDITDKALQAYTLEEKTELFIALQNEIIVGEGNASK